MTRVPTVLPPGSFPGDAMAAKIGHGGTIRILPPVDDPYVSGYGDLIVDLIRSGSSDETILATFPTLMRESLAAYKANVTRGTYDAKPGKKIADSLIEYMAGGASDATIAASEGLAVRQVEAIRKAYRKRIEKRTREVNLRRIEEAFRDCGLED